MRIKDIFGFDFIDKDTKICIKNFNGSKLVEGTLESIKCPDSFEVEYFNFFGLGNKLQIVLTQKEERNIIRFYHISENEFEGNFNLIYGNNTLRGYWSYESGIRYERIKNFLDFLSIPYLEINCKDFKNMPKLGSVIEI